MSDLLPFVIAGLGTGAVYALSGVGLVVLYRATGVLNFAFGAIGALSAFVAWALINGGYPVALGVIAGIAAATFASFVYGGAIAPLLAYRDRVVRAIGTLGYALILLGMIGWYWGQRPRRLQFDIDRMYLEIAEARFTYTRGLALIVMALMVVGITILLARTRLGLSMRALANNRDLSALIGVRVLSVETASWLLSGAFAGVCGIFLANFVRLQAILLTFLVIPAIAASLIGRLSSLWLTALAGLGIGLVESLLTAWPDVAPYRSASPYIIALLAVALSGRASAIVTEER